MNNKKITYIFGGGRKKKIENGGEFAEDMFYGYFGLNEKYDVQIYETIKADFKIYKFLAKFLNKLTGLGFHFENSLKKQDKKNIFESNEIFFGNQQILFSLFYLCPKLNRKKIIVNVFAMGLVGGKKNFLTKILLRYLFKYIQRVIFISEAEYESAKDQFPNFKDLFFYNPFGVDSKFWNKTVTDKNDQNYILFIGNDLNRDYEFLLKLIQDMPDFNFKIISNRIVKNDFDFKNAELINGDWHSQEITDSKIREYYSSAFLTIIPLKNSIQPSGQSVCLQSMLCETPVLISETKGFWNPNNLINNEHLYIQKTDIKLWKDTIYNLFQNENLRIEIQQNAKKIVLERYTVQNFTEKLDDFLSN